MSTVGKVRVQPILYFYSERPWYGDSTEDVVAQWNQAVQNLGQLEAQAKRVVRTASGSLDMELISQAAAALNELRNAIEEFMNRPWVSELQSAFAADAARFREEERETYQNIRQQVEEIVQYNNSVMGELPVGDSYPAILHKVVYYSWPVRTARIMAEAAERLERSVRMDVERAFWRLRDYLEKLNIDTVLTNREAFLAAAPIAPAA